MKLAILLLLLCAGCGDAPSYHCAELSDAYLTRDRREIDEAAYFAKRANDSCCEAKHRGITGEWPGCGIVEEFGPCRKPKRSVTDGTESWRNEKHN